MRGYTVAQLVEALRCKPEGREFRLPMRSLGFFFICSFRSHCGCAIDYASNRNVTGVSSGGKGVKTAVGYG